MQSQFNLGKYNRDLKISRVSYAQELIGYAQKLEINMSEPELIKTIGRHYSYGKEIPKTIIMQTVETFGKLFDIL